MTDTRNDAAAAHAEVSAVTEATQATDSNPAELALPDNGIPVATVTDADFPFQTF
mgnify:CR=1 FL=1